MKRFNCFTREGDLFLSNMSISFQTRVALFCEVIKISQRVVGKRGLCLHSSGFTTNIVLARREVKSKSYKGFDGKVALNKTREDKWLVHLYDEMV